MRELVGETHGDPDVVNEGVCECARERLVPDLEYTLFTASELNPLFLTRIRRKNQHQLNILSTINTASIIRERGKCITSTHADQYTITSTDKYAQRPSLNIVQHTRKE